eukprot:625063-Prymnesium_polylepis.1
MCMRAPSALHPHPVILASSARATLAPHPRVQMREMDSLVAELTALRAKMRDGKHDAQASAHHSATRC